MRSVLDPLLSESTGGTEPTERQQDTGTSSGDGRDAMDDSNGHVWQTESRHATSNGVVSYQRCRCGRWRVLLGSNRVLGEAGPHT